MFLQNLRRLSRSSFLVVSLFAGIAACGGSDPVIRNTAVTPAVFQQSPSLSSAQFVLTTDALHLGGRIVSVTATVKDPSGKAIGDTLTLGKSKDVPGGEQWVVSASIPLINFATKGVYSIDITATNDSRTSVTQTNGATVTIQ